MIKGIHELLAAFFPVSLELLLLAGAAAGLLLSKQASKKSSPRKRVPIPVPTRDNQIASKRRRA